MSAAAPSARMIAGGASRRGSLVSSASVPAVSNPYITYALMIPPIEEGAEVAPASGRRRCHRMWTTTAGSAVRSGR